MYVQRDKQDMIDTLDASVAGINSVHIFIACFLIYSLYNIKKEGNHEYAKC